MKTWVKVLLGLVAGSLLLVALALVLLVRSGRWEQVKGMAGGISQLKQGTEDLERMQREHPFTPAADAVLAEPRLQIYLEICESLQPYVKPYEAWMEAHAGRQGDFKDAVEAIGFIGRISSRAAQSFRASGMTPKEFAWVHRCVRKGMEEVQGKGTSADVQELLAVLRKAAADPGIAKPMKAELQRTLERHEARIKAAAEPLSANGRICALHADRIRRADLGDLASLILEGAAKGKRRR